MWRDLDRTNGVDVIHAASADGQLSLCRMPAGEVEPAVSWILCPRGPVPLDNEIHVWRAPELSSFGFEGAKLINSEEERAHADTLRGSGLRASYLTRRATLRSILSRYLAIPPSDIRYRYGARGKPYLDAAPTIQFSATSSSGLVLVAVANVPVGIDVEVKRTIPEVDLIAGRYFADSEIDLLRRSTEAERSNTFLRQWVRKEALAKADGEGIATYIAYRSRVEVDVEATVVAFDPTDRHVASVSHRSFDQTR